MRSNQCADTTGYSIAELTTLLLSVQVYRKKFEIYAMPARKFRFA